MRLQPWFVVLLDALDIRLHVRQFVIQAMVHIDMVKSECVQAEMSPMNEELN